MAFLSFWASCKRSERGRARFLAPLLPAVEEETLVTKGARSNRGWGEVLGAGNRGGECRASVDPAPGHEKLR